MLAVVSGLFVALLTSAAAQLFAEEVLFSDEKMQQRMQSYQTQLQTFVTENDIHSLDSEQLNSWAEQHSNISLFIYKENKLILKTGTVVSQTQTTEATQPVTERPDPPDDRYDRDPFRPGPQRSFDDTEERLYDDMDDFTTEAPTEPATDAVTETTTVVYEVFTGDDADIVYEEGAAASAFEDLLLTRDSGYFEVSFADGTAVACIIDNSETAVRNITLFGSIIVSFLTFAVIILAYNQKKVNDIVSLSQRVHRIGNGELELPIEVRGQDEIAMLADEVDTMRCSVLEKIEKEKKALAAGHELVATMSHDIRTPLTALMGYLDILHEHRFDDAQLEKKYLEACRSKAQQLKNLSDRLFHYFLVFGQPVAPLSPESINAQLLLSQVLGEQTQFLLENGFQVQYESYEGDDTLFVDAHEIYRVFDNVFSNISRYADRKMPVCVGTAPFAQGLCVRIVNNIDTAAAHSESTGFGLKICERVLRESGGSFEYEEKDGVFTVRICLPVENPAVQEKRKKK